MSMTNIEQCQFFFYGQCQLLLLFFGEFQLRTSATNDSFLSSHQTKTPISFQCRQVLNLKSLFQLSKIWQMKHSLLPDQKCCWFLVPSKMSRYSSAKTKLPSRHLQSLDSLDHQIIDDQEVSIFYRLVVLSSRNQACVPSKLSLIMIHGIKSSIHIWKINFS